MCIILHLTNTNIKSDSRILKEMNVLANSNYAFDIYGLGDSRDDHGKNSTNIDKNITVYSVLLKSRSLTFLPKTIRQVLTPAELTIKMIVKAVRLKPKVLHCHDTVVLPLGVMVKLFTGAKLIYDAHELESNRGGLSKTFGKFTLFSERLLWRFVDALIVVSPSINKWYKDNIGEKYSEVILNSPILEKEIPPDNKTYFRDVFSIPNDSKIFLYVGSLSNGRGIDLITEVFKSPKCKSHVVFLGYGELSSKLKRLSKEHNNIHLHEAVPYERVVSVAQSADVGLCLIQNVSLSDYYCLPNKLFEYCPGANLALVCVQHAERDVPGQADNQFGSFSRIESDRQEILSRIYEKIMSCIFKAVLQF